LRPGDRKAALDGSESTFYYFYYLDPFEMADMMISESVKNTRHASAGFGWQAHPGGFLYQRGLL
jgi:hypothetical protein